MIWFKHDITARKDVKLKKLVKKFGVEGYGVYFSLLEIIADNIKTDNCWEWGFVDKEHDLETLADEVGVSVEKLAEILSYANEINLLYKIDGRLCCPQLLSRLDRYSTQHAQKEAGFDLAARKEELNQAWINGMHTKGTLTVHTLPHSAPLTEEIRTEKKRKEQKEESERGENNIAAKAADFSKEYQKAKEIADNLRGVF